MATREGGVGDGVDVLAWIDTATIAVGIVADGSYTVMKAKAKPVRDAVIELINAAEKFKVEAAKIDNAEAYKKAAERLEAALLAARGNA